MFFLFFLRSFVFDMFPAREDVLHEIPVPFGLHDDDREPLILEIEDELVRLREAVYL